MKKIISLVLMASILCGMIFIPTNASFNDINSPKESIAAGTLEGLSIVSGTGGGNFNPQGVLTRAEASMMIVNMMGLSNQLNTYARRTYFSDVPSDSW